MRRKFNPQDKGKVVEFWLKGLSYRQISERSGASLGTISAEIEKVRKTEPDLDCLRELSVALQKSCVDIMDVIRNCSLFSRLNELGVGVDELCGYVELSKKLAVGPELLQAAFKIQKLESETGKSFEEVSKEFEEKATQLKELDKKIQTLRNELKQAQKQREIGQLCEQMKAAGVEPGRLKEFIDSRGSLEKQLRSLEEEINQGKARLSILAKMEKDIQRRVDDIQRIERILKSRTCSFACTHCGWTTVKEIKSFEAQLALTQGAPLVVTCGRCGQPNYYNPIPALLNLALQTLS